MLLIKSNNFYLLLYTRTNKIQKQDKKHKQHKQRNPQTTPITKKENKYFFYLDNKNIQIKKKV